jgi:hypothetical protein
MGWFSNLFGGKKAVDNILDKDNGLLTQVGGWIGNMNYTDEEKAKADAETRKWGIEMLKALAPFKVVQRVLAFAVASLWIIVALNVIVMIWFDHPQLEMMMDFAMSAYVWVPTSGVFGLYFGGGVINSYKGK